MTHVSNPIYSYKSRYIAFGRYAWPRFFLFDHLIAITTQTSFSIWV